MGFFTIKVELHGVRFSYLAVRHEKRCKSGNLIHEQVRQKIVFILDYNLIRMWTNKSTYSGSQTVSVFSHVCLQFYKWHKLRWQNHPLYIYIKENCFSTKSPKSITNRDKLFTSVSNINTLNSCQLNANHVCQVDIFHLISENILKLQVSRSFLSIGIYSKR